MDYTTTQAGLKALPITKTKKKMLFIVKTLSTITILFLLSSFFSPLYAQHGPFHRCPDCPAYERSPFGEYCPQKGGYGERRPVKEPEEALRLTKEYFANLKDVDFKIIKWRKRFFIIEIRQKDGTLVDIVILDRRTGRIRSIY